MTQTTLLYYDICPAMWTWEYFDFFCNLRANSHSAWVFVEVMRKEFIVLIVFACFCFWSFILHLQRFFFPAL